MAHLNASVNRLLYLITLLLCSTQPLNLLSCNFTHITNKTQKIAEKMIRNTDSIIIFLISYFTWNLLNSSLWSINHRNFALLRLFMLIQPCSSCLVEHSTSGYTISCSKRCEEIHARRDNSNQKYVYVFSTIILFPRSKQKFDENAPKIIGK